MEVAIYVVLLPMLALVAFGTFALMIKLARRPTTTEPGRVAPSTSPSSSPSTSPSPAGGTKPTPGPGE